jgi:Fur family transcriptional regulator, peroxide stress response regulator
VTKKARQLQIEHFVMKCKAAGLNVTPQRLAIFQAILGDESHPSPDAVCKRIRKVHPTISHATVYNALETFERHGLISRLTPLHETVRYDPITAQHHHIICVRCKKVTNLHDAGLDALSIPRCVKKENAVMGYSVHIHVLCGACRGLG